MVKKQRIENARSLVLLTGALVMAVTFAVGSAGWTKGLNIITFVGLGSILIGLMIARSILPAIIGHIFSLIIGIGWSFWVTTRLLPSHYTWLERWQNLAIRLNAWYNQAMQGGTSYDNLMFILQMAVIVWCVGYLTVWFVFRTGKVWQAIVPGGVVLIMNLYYAPNDVTFWFLVYLLVAFLLVIRFNILYQEAKWRSEGIFFRPDVSFDFLRDGFIFSALVIGIAWLAPPVIDAKALGLLDEFEGTWHDVQSNWNRLYADLNYRDQTVSVGTFGQSFALGGPRLLTDEPVMAVQVEGVGRYWRATVYDEYNGVGWRSSQQDTASIGPDELPALPQYAATYPVTQTYTMFRQSATVLYAMAGISYLDRTAKVTFNELSREQIATIAALPRWPNSDGPIMEGITYIRSNAAVEEGESYQVISDISQATVSQLRSDGADYPAWIRNRYLQLPPLTDRTRELAQQITQDYETPFDKAQAVERYLRNNIKYNERIPAPPPGVDKVDYILFELGQAYCDYYATSMIVMLRSVGVPARMAAGFARGKYDAERDVFRVVNADAHSWVEVYFPTYGWVEFEPTAAQPTIIRPSNPDENSFSAGNIPNLDNLPDGSRAGYEEGLFGDNNIPIDDGFFAGGIFLSFNLPIFGTQINIPRSAVSSSFSLVGLLALLGLGGGALWWQRQQSLANKNIFNLYEGMLKFGRWMGALLQPWQTPYEHAAILQERLPTFKKEVTVITDDYVYHTFSPVDKLNPPPDRVAEESRTAWLRLRPTMAKLAIKQLIPPRLRFWQ